MRAAVQVGYGGADTSLRLDDVAVPRPGPDDVLVRVEGSTLNRKDLFALENLTGPGHPSASAAAACQRYRRVGNGGCDRVERSRLA